jgi:hypothetical protein
MVADPIYFLGLTPFKRYFLRGIMANRGNQHTTGVTFSIFTAATQEKQ